MANRIHPTAIVGDGVELGEDNVIGPYTVLVGPTKIGNGNWIGPHVTIGTPAESRGDAHPVGWDGELDGVSGVEIGDRNTLREYVTVHQGTHRASTIGSDCYLLRGSHVGHDVLLGDGVTLACGVLLGGHTHVWSFANVGMSTVVHQFGRIGPGAMVGMASAVRKEVGAFTITVGNPARTTGVNVVGLSRRGCSEELISELSEFVKGKAELPSGLPEDLGTLLKAWSERPPFKS